MSTYYDAAGGIYYDQALFSSHPRTHFLGYYPISSFFLAFAHLIRVPLMDG